MVDIPRKINLSEWDERYAQLRSNGLVEPSFGGSLSRHLEDGDRRLLKLQMDNSPAALRLWNFLLTEEDRLHSCVQQGHQLVGTMKDLGTVPVMAYALENVTAFYPDGAWWLPCLLECSDGLLEIADSLGIDDSFCPVRAMLGAFVSKNRFPIPGILTCSVGATCDDFSAIAQRVESLGYHVHWWEMPHRRHPDSHEEAVELPGGFCAPTSQVDFVKSELDRIRHLLESYSGQCLGDEQLAHGIDRANLVRRNISNLRKSVFTADICPMPALEMLIVEMLGIHFCSDYNETLEIVNDLQKEVERRVKDRVGVLSPNAVRIFWINPVADLRMMNLLEDLGGRVCGTDYMVGHALSPIPTDIPPLEALAQVALADPMVGSAVDRAKKICDDICRFRAEGVVISRIPGASHCATEGEIIGETIRGCIDVPVVEIEVPSVADAMEITLRTRLEALIELVKERRDKNLS